MQISELAHEAEISGVLWPCGENIWYFQHITIQIIYSVLYQVIGVIIHVSERTWPGQVTNTTFVNMSDKDVSHITKTHVIFSKSCSYMTCATATKPVKYDRKIKRGRGDIVSFNDALFYMFSWLLHWQWCSIQSDFLSDCVCGSIIGEF